VTLVESAKPSDREMADALLQTLLPHTGNAHRIAVSGPPGVGKSTLIEAMGSRLLDRGRRVAVLAIDPSSALSGGSILADKTRMTRLATDPRAFVRPSPSARTLGGVARRTREVMLLVEAAGYDVVIVETVGVGQSETEAYDMVDTFLLLVLPGSGDELQGIKRGILEMAHVVAVNKADGELLIGARVQARLFEDARSAAGDASGSAGVMLVSALTGVGVDALLERLEAHGAALVESGELDAVRKRQSAHAVLAHIEEDLLDAFHKDARVIARLPALLEDVEAGRRTPGAAAHELVLLFSGHASEIAR
jgi:LAO/AO transport system kinase